MYFQAITKQELLFILASFIWGLITGMLLLNLILGNHLDQLIYEKNELLTKVETQQTKLEKLEESLAQEKKTIIQELEIKIITELDKHTKQQLKQKIFDILNSLIGRSITEIDPTLLAQTIDQRIIIIEGTKYKLDLIWFIIQPHSIVSLKIDKDA